MWKEEEEERSVMKMMVKGSGGRVLKHCLWKGEVGQE
jgi:hypothetical protein